MSISSLTTTGGIQEQLLSSGKFMVELRITYHFYDYWNWIFKAIVFSFHPIKIKHNWILTIVVIYFVIYFLDFLLKMCLAVVIKKIVKIFRNLAQTFLYSNISGNSNITTCCKIWLPKYSFWCCCPLQLFPAEVNS